MDLTTELPDASAVAARRKKHSSHHGALNTRLSWWIVLAVVLGSILGGMLVPLSSASAGTPTEYWLGEYYGNTSLSPIPLVFPQTRTDNTIDFNWGTGGPGLFMVGTDNFSVRWTRTLYFHAGTYEFKATADDGVQLYIDDALVIDQWHDHTVTTHTGYKYLSEGLHTIKMQYYERGGGALAKLTWAPVDWALFTGWKGEYYNNTNLSGGEAAYRDDAKVDFNWGTNEAITGVGRDNFSVRWTKDVPFAAGIYRFQTSTDDGVRLYVDNQLCISHWADQSFTIHQVDTYLTRGTHSLRMEYFERSGTAIAQLEWWPMPAASYSGWKGEYYSNKTLSGVATALRDDPAINFNWGTASPIEQVPADNFSVRWTRSPYFAAGTYAFSTTSDDGVRLYVDGSLLIDHWVDQSQTTYTANRVLAAGNHTIKMEYYEATTDAVAKLSWALVNTTPTITGLNPTYGPTAGGTTVTITGSNFAAPASVSFGTGNAATAVTVVNPTTITCTSPAHAAGAVDVRVTTGGGTSATGAADLYTYADVTPAPIVTGLNPTYGPTAGGTTVTITGSNFAAPASVSFGTGNAATAVTVVNPTTITCTSPAHAAGAVDVRVTTGGGTSATGAADLYAYTDVVPAPTVTGVSPNSGPAAGGNEVVINGTDLSEATSVHFGAAEATVTNNTDAQITVVAPAGSGTVDVRVTTGGGTSALSAADRYTYVETPAVTFTDVPADHPYHDAIYGLYNAEIINGYHVGSTWEFRPGNTVLRAQFVKMLCGAVDLTVSEDDWPDPSVPFLDLTDEVDLLPGPGVTDSLYPHEYVAVAFRNQITFGLTPTNFGSYTGIKRAQLVTMVVRAVQTLQPSLLAAPPLGYNGTLGAFDVTHSANMKTAEYNGLLHGLVGFGPPWAPYAYATRGETAQVLWNLMGMLD